MITLVEYVVRDVHGRDYWRTYPDAESARRCRDANNDPLDPHDPAASVFAPWTVIKRTITEESILDAGGAN